MNSNKVYVGMAIMAITGFTVGMVYGYYESATISQRTAVRAGHARFVADDNGAVKFVWNEPCGRKP